VHAPLIVFCARELALLRRTLHRASVPRRHLLLLLAQQPLHDAVLVEHVARLEGQRDLHGGAGGGGGSGGPSLDSRAESGISLDGSIQLSSAQPITGSDSGGGGDALAVGAALVRSVEASAARFEQLGAQVEP